MGKEIIGYAQNCSLTPANGVWSVFCVKDLATVQSGYRLVNGHLQLPRQEIPESIPICQLSEIATVGSRVYDMKGKNKKKILKIEKGCPDTADYPCLHHVHKETQRSMVVQPDSHGLLRSNLPDDIEKIKQQNSRIHYNMYLRYNTNSLTVMFTEQNTLGVNLIPSIIFKDKNYEYVWTLWCNSTLGLLCHWMNSSKQHLGRGIYARTDLRSLPTLDVRQLNQFQLTIAESIFHNLKLKRMLPFNQILDDPVRQELDRLLLSKILGLGENTHPEVHEGLDLLRLKLCKEPSIHGGTDQKCNLEKEARELKLQSENLNPGQDGLFL